MNPVNLLVFMLFLSMPVFSQVAEKKKVFGLNDCISYAWENNLSVRQAELRVNQAEISTAEAMGKMFPTLGINSSWQLSDYPNLATSSGSTQSIQAGLSGSLDLFSGARSYNNWKRAETDENAEMEQLITRKNEIRLSVISSYLQVLLYAEREFAAENQTDASKKNLRLIQSKSEIGLAATYAVQQAESRLAADEYALATARGNLKLAELNMKQVLNYPGDSLITIRVDIPISIQSRLSDSVVTTGHVLEVARGHLPELRYAGLAKQSAGFQAMVANGAWFPTLSLNYGISSGWNNQYTTGTATGQTANRVTGFLESDPSQRVISTEPVFSYATPSFSEQLNDNLNPYVGLTLSFPILDSGTRSAAIQQSSIAVTQADVTISQTELAVRQSVEQAVTNFHSSRSQFLSAQIAYQVATEAFRQTEERYRQGLVSLLDYQTETNNFRKLESDYIQAKYQHVLNRLVLDYYENKELEW